MVHREAHVRQRQSFFDRPLARPMGTSLNLALRHKNGSDLPVDVCLGQFTDEGQFYALAAIRDITERRRMEEELRLAKEAAERAYEAFAKTCRQRPGFREPCCRLPCLLSKACNFAGNSTPAPNWPATA